MRNQSTYDLFISYADDDVEWVEGFLLPSLGISDERVLTKEDFRPGSDKITEFERAVTNSRYTLLILSPAFFGDIWATYGNSLAAYARVEQQMDRLVPLFLKPCELPPHLGALIPLDCTSDIYYQQALTRLHDLLSQPEPELTSQPCPYPGMVPFSEAESASFFGRDREIEEFLQRLRLYPFITVIGPSGSGKSSFVFAGVIPALRRSGLFNEKEWQIHSMRPSVKPLTRFNQIRSNLVSSSKTLLVIDQFEEIFTSEKQEVIPFQHALQELFETPQCYIVITVRADFYPDLMTCALWEQIQQHRMEILPLDKAGLYDAIVRPAANIGVFLETVLVERLIADAAGEPGVLPFIQETLVLLWEKLERQFLPLKAYEDLTTGRTQQTGLQVAMTRRADAALAELNERQHIIARRIFLRLIQFGEGRPDTRRQQTVKNLRSADERHEEFDETLEHLVAKRLLTRSGEEADEHSRVDIAHEALIEGWPTFQTWIHERRRAEQTRRQLDLKVAEWERLGREAGLLDEMELHEAKEWLESADAAELGISESLYALVKISQKAIESELEKARKTTTKLHNRLTVAIVLLVLAVGAAGIAWYNSKRASRNEEIAVQQTNLAKKEAERAKKNEDLANEQKEIAEEQKIRAQQERDNALITQSLFLADLARQQREAGNVTNAILLALEALPKNVSTPDRPYVPEVEKELYRAVNSPRELHILEGHKNGVARAFFSPDGQYVLTTSRDGTARVWEVTSGKKVATLAAKYKGLNDEVHELFEMPPSEFTIGVALAFVSMYFKGFHYRDFYGAFSPDSKRIITLTGDNSVHIWETTSGDLLTSFVGHEDRVWHAAFSSDGQLVVTASGDGTARVWEVSSGEQIAVLDGHEGGVRYAMFRPGARHVVTVSEHNAIYLWDISRGERTPILAQHESEDWHTVTFSSDGQRVVTASDHIAYVWQVENGNQLAILEGHDADIWYATFSHDGHKVVTTSFDGTARVWEVSKDESPPAWLLSNEPHPPVILQGHEVDRKLGLGYATFSPDGQYVITAMAGDHTARIWSSSTGAQLAILGHEDRIHYAAFSPNGRYVVTASADHTARLWDISQGNLIGEIEGGSCRGVAGFSFNGQRKIKISNNIANVLSTLEGDVLTTLDGHGDDICHAVFSPDGKCIATGSLDNTARVWDASRGDLLAILTGHDDIVCHTVFSPDGRIIATGSWDNTARLWETNNGKLLTVLRGHNGDICHLVFSSDGQYIATTSRDRTARIWKVSNGEQVFRLSGHESWVSYAAFSLDGQKLITSSEDGAVRLWDVASGGKLLTELKGHKKAVYRAAFSSDGQHLITASKDHTIRVWELQNGESLEVLERGVYGNVCHLVFYPDGLHILVIFEDGTVRLWRVFLSTQALIDYARETIPRKELAIEQRKKFFLLADEEI